MKRVVRDRNGGKKRNLSPLINECFCYRIYTSMDGMGLDEGQGRHPAAWLACFWASWGMPIKYLEYFRCAGNLRVYIAISFRCGFIRCPLQLHLQERKKEAQIFADGFAASWLVANLLSVYLMWRGIYYLELGKLKPILIQSYKNKHFI